MPAFVEPHDDFTHAAHQIVLSPSSTDYLDQLIPAIREASLGNRTQQLVQSLSQVSSDREAKIEQVCNSNHQEFVTSVNQLLRVREGTVSLTSEILGLNQSIQTSTEKLAQQKKGLVESRGVRQNLDEAAQALEDCSEVLRLANHVHDLLGKKNHYAALRALDELQNVHLKEVTQYKIAEMIQKSVPATQRLIAEAVMTDLNTWLYRIRETSQFLGEVAFYRTELRRTRLKERADKMTDLSDLKLTSAVELVSDETEEFDILDNEDVQIDFTPLFESLHIHAALGQTDKFRAEYAATRRRQKELLLPTSITLVDEDEASLSGLLEGIAGFAIIERATMKKAQDFRLPVDVDELWDSMCQVAVSLISKALHEVDNAELVLKIKGVIALFIQTMDGWDYPVYTLDSFLLTLFEKYSELLRRRFSDDFQEIVSTDDYMPMPINNLDEYDKVVNHPSIIDETLRTSLDGLLSEKVCKSLVERLSSQYLGQIVQILINLEHFEVACQELEQLLMAARSSAAPGPVILNATAEFKNNKKTAENRIFELVNSKIDDLIETAEYDWMAPTLETEPSNYMQTLTRYLSNIMNSVLLGLPTEIKELIYFDALSHAATMILSLPLDPEVKRINPNGVSAVAKDVRYLTEFVDTLGNPILRKNLDELQQTVALMQADNSDEYYDITTRNKKYGRVDAATGPILLEKLTHTVQSPTKTDKFTALSSRFGMK
ncbi:Exocyst complex component 6 [Acarospora aff. strigata]|nr:Exocyst complex component 6 [Acarospora aff. strigata]